MAEFQPPKSAIIKRDSFGVLDPTIDLQWANQYRETGAQHTYFDYYFSGQDIQVHVDGVSQYDEDSQLPIASLAIQIEQQKTPIFGFWDYTYSQVMRGTRLVSGALALHTTSTDYMVNLLSKAATGRVNGNQEYVLRGLDTDEKHIEQYWTRNINADIAYSNNKSLFNSHPPFNLIIMYGLQSVSLASNRGEQYAEVLGSYQNDTPLFTDTNERLVATETDNSMRIVLYGCELTKMSTEYAPDGSPIIEQYQFFAKDIATPRSGSTYSRRSTGTVELGS